MDIEHIKQGALQIQQWLVQIRRDLHMYPELGLQENRTMETIKDHLRQMEIGYETYEGQNAVVATIYGAFPGKTVGIRADMDALPLCEANDVPYQSKVPGVMHACGHDAHVAMLLGTARLFQEARDELHGNIKLLFQPAEESVGGADSMVKAGCMKNPDVDYVIGLHVMPNLPYGTVETKYGSLNAATDDITITVHGKSAHGAYPDLGVDAISIAGHIITALQTIVSRNVSPLDSVVFTIGTISGGTRRNILSNEVKMEATLRTVNPATRESVKEKIRNIVRGVCESLGGQGTVEIECGYEALINTEEVVDKIIDAAKDMVGAQNLVLREKPSLGAEDFSYFIDAAKGAFYHIGCADPEKAENAPLHHCSFDIDERCLAVGVMMHVQTALKLMEN